MTAAALSGFPRGDGRFGVRNHVLVMPSVVCSSHSAGAIAGDAALAIAHQHGCLHVGDDLRHTRSELIGTACNPNVAAVVVVSLGCETINGARLAEAIAERGQRVELVGIQAAGGTAAAIDAGRAAVARLAQQVDDLPREPMAAERLCVGLDVESDDDADPLGAAVARRLAARGLTVVRAPAGLTGAEAHVTLAGEGAQLIVTIPPADGAPTGFVVCPVLAVARDVALHHALVGDFDVVGAAGDPFEATAAQVLARVLAHAEGLPTAAERRGARDFVLHRLAMTM